MLLRKLSQRGLLCRRAARAYACVHVHTAHRRPMPDAQALGLEVNTVTAELRATFGLESTRLLCRQTVPEKELRRPWDPEGQCNGFTRQGVQCKVQPGSKSRPIHDPSPLTRFTLTPANG